MLKWLLQIADKFATPTEPLLLIHRLCFILICETHQMTQESQARLSGATLLTVRNTVVEISLTGWYARALWYLFCPAQIVRLPFITITAALCDNIAKSLGESGTCQVLIPKSIDDQWVKKNPTTYSALGFVFPLRWSLTDLSQRWISNWIEGHWTSEAFWLSVLEPDAHLFAQIKDHFG